MTPLQQKTIKAIVNVFETGRAAGDYSAVTVIPGDSGHLTYGRSQSALGSGSLFQLLSQYTVAPGAKYAAQIQPYLPRLQAKDVTLDNDATLRSVLREAGSDPVMQAEQDRFFDANYFNPACTSAGDCGLKSALAQAVVYDSYVQGNWRGMREATDRKCGAPGSNGVTEQQWLTVYVQTRKQWLSGSRPPLPATVYRMDAFLNLITNGNWNLDLPIQVHGVTIAAADLDETADATPPSLRMTSPPMKGDSIRKLQASLTKAGFDCAEDGVFGPTTEAAVKAFQAAKGMSQSGVVGPEIWAALA
jgi:chitosanase